MMGGNRLLQWSSSSSSTVSALTRLSTHLPDHPAPMPQVPAYLYSCHGTLNPCILHPFKPVLSSPCHSSSCLLFACSTFCSADSRAHSLL